MVWEKLRAPLIVWALAASAVAGLVVGVLASCLVHVRPAKVPTAAATASPTLASVQALVQQASHGNAAAEQLLLGRPLGLTAALVRANGQPFVAWITPDGQGFLIGALFNEQGENLTLAAMQRNHVVPQVASQDMADKPRPAKGELIDAVEKADGFTEGKSGLLVHTFVDLECGYCGTLYQQLRPLIEKGQVRVHWIPVAVLRASSMNLAAEVLQAARPAGREAGGEVRGS